MNILNKKRLTILSLTIIIVLCGYTYLWFHAAEKLEDWLLESLNRMEQQGYLPAYDRIEIKGFPFKLEARFLNPIIQLPKPVALKISGPQLITATTSIWNPRLVTIKGKEKISFFLIGDQAEEYPLASIDQLQIRGELNSHFSQDYSVLLTGIQTPAWKAQEISFAFTNDHRANNANEISLNVINVNSITALNNSSLPLTIENISLTANYLMPIKMKGNLVSTLKDWADHDGVIDLENFNITWGDIRLEGNGSMSLDQEMQPLAALSVKIYGIEPILNVMVKQHIIHKSIVAIIKTALSLLKENDGGQQEKYYKIPISIQDRELSLAGIPIKTFDPIIWGEIDF
jgi:hypothetical protein